MVGEVDAVELDAARGGPVETAEHLEQRGLAAAGGALDDELVAVLDGEVDAGSASTVSLPRV